MNQQIRTIADLDRVIHEPGRLMIVALLFAGTFSSPISRLERRRTMLRW